jgi:hypothetical protein
VTSREGSGTAAGISEIERYLKVQADIGRARQEAEAFTERLPWLTTAQRRDVAAAYTRQRLHTAHQHQQALSARCADLETVYERRVRQLRMHITVTVLLAAATASFLSALAYALLH